MKRRSDAGSPGEPSRPKIAFVLIGGPHQLLHIAPVAAALIRRGDSDVIALVDTAGTASSYASLVAALGAGGAATRILEMPAWARWLGRHNPKWFSAKLPRLIHARRLARRYDVVVTAERTSTILKRLPGPKPLMVHIPHGAGDRAKGFERRIKLFDLVLVAGEKDRARMIAAGVARAQTCVATGYIKLEAVDTLRGNRPVRFFADDRPIVLYNPHFEPSLSSWPRFGKAIIAAFAAQDRYNLIVAPHVRLFATANDDERGAVRACATDRILIDLGSANAFDMSYTLAADLYLGDVSSQVYEFIAQPQSRSQARPCLFLDAHATAWADDPNYACWSFGEVLTSTRAIMPAIARALAGEGQRGFAAAQERGRREALGEPHGAAERTAQRILALAAGAR